MEHAENFLTHVSSTIGPVGSACCASLALTLLLWCYFSSTLHQSETEHEEAPRPKSRSGTLHCTLHTYKDSSITTTELQKLYDSPKFDGWLAENSTRLVERVAFDQRQRLWVRIVVVLLVAMGGCCLLTDDKITLSEVVGQQWESSPPKLVCAVTSWGGLLLMVALGEGVNEDSISVLCLVVFLWTTGSMWCLSVPLLCLVGAVAIKLFLH